MSRNGSARWRESGVRCHFPMARLVPPWPRCLAGCLAKCPQGKAKERVAKPEFTHYASEPGELISPQRRIVGEGNLRPPPCAERKGPPPKTWRRRCPNQGKRYPQGPVPDGHPHRAMPANGPALHRAVIQSLIRRYCVSPRSITRIRLLQSG